MQFTQHRTGEAPVNTVLAVTREPQLGNRVHLTRCFKAALFYHMLGVTPACHRGAAK